MNRTVSQVRVEIFDSLEGLICTFPCRSLAEAEALLETLVVQPENAAYFLRLMGANGALLQYRPGGRVASYNFLPT